MFESNGLQARGVSELTFTREEVMDKEVLGKLGFYFANVVRGDAKMPTDLFDEESVPQFPGYAWTPAARATVEEWQKTRKGNS